LIVVSATHILPAAVAFVSGNAQTSEAFTFVATYGTIGNASAQRSSHPSDN